MRKCKFFRSACIQRLVGWWQLLFQPAQNSSQKVRSLAKNIEAEEVVKLYRSYSALKRSQARWRWSTLLILLGLLGFLVFDIMLRLNILRQPESGGEKVLEALENSQVAIEENQAVLTQPVFENNLQRISNSVDKQSPQILDLQTEANLIDRNKIQTIITWQTDEPAIAALSYRETKDGPEQVAMVNSNYSSKHNFISIKLQPGTLYYYTLQVADQAGNKTLSRTYTLLTPGEKTDNGQGALDSIKLFFGIRR